MCMKERPGCLAVLEGWRAADGRCAAWGGEGLSWPRGRLQDVWLLFFSLLAVEPSPAGAGVTERAVVRRGVGEQTGNPVSQPCGHCTHTPSL